MLYRVELNFNFVTPIRIIGTFILNIDGRLDRWRTMEKIDWKIYILTDWLTDISECTNHRYNNRFLVFSKSNVDWFQFVLIPRKSKITEDMWHDFRVIMNLKWFSNISGAPSLRIFVWGLNTLNTERELSLFSRYKFISRISTTIHKLKWHFRCQMQCDVLQHFITIFNIFFSSSCLLVSWLCYVAVCTIIMYNEWTVFCLHIL